MPYVKIKDFEKLESFVHGCREKMLQNQENSSLQGVIKVRQGLLSEVYSIQKSKDRATEVP